MIFANQNNFWPGTQHHHLSQGLLDVHVLITYCGPVLICNIKPSLKWLKIGDLWV